MHAREYARDILNDTTTFTIYENRSLCCLLSIYYPLGLIIIVTSTKTPVIWIHQKQSSCLAIMQIRLPIPSSNRYVKIALYQFFIRNASRLIFTSTSLSCT